VGTPSDLVVPGALARELAEIVQVGSGEASAWAAAHPGGPTDSFDRDALASVVTPPSGAAQERELDELRALRDARTAPGMQRAVYLGRRDGWDEWNAALAEVGAKLGPVQARRAQRLLQQVTERTDSVVDAAKAKFDRARPFQLDPSLSSALGKVGGNPSHPSGHTSAAYAAALLLATFLPERATELVDLAAEIGFSRMYGGVHFHSDVIVGARLAARVVADVLRRDAASAKTLVA
jgi:hypothetical protein